jgi:hypothetical protein|tara:strand:- start:181 stop:471 length:291 start_codon:yes stop_codon:yes gene_type:complete
MNIKNLIKTEIKNHTDLEYWGTEENINNENIIFDYVLDNNIVNQDWFDEKLKYTSVELLEELLKVVKFFEAHQLSNEEMKDKEYMESLLENYNENK